MKRCFCSSVPWWMIVGPTKPMPRPLTAAGALTRAISFADDRLLHRARFLAAILFRPAHADEAGLVELAVPCLALLERLQLLPGQILCEPGAHLLLISLVLGGHVQIHRHSPAARLFSRPSAPSRRDLRLSIARDARPVAAPQRG